MERSLYLLTGIRLLSLLVALTVPLGVSGDCALYGCTLSLSFTCPTDFYPPPATNSSSSPGPRGQQPEVGFWPDLAYSVEDKTLKPTGAGCVTNSGKIVCPFTGDGKLAQP